MPFMDNLAALRMNSIYGSGGNDNPFTPPNYDPVENQLRLYDQLKLRQFGESLHPQTAAGFARMGQPTPTSVDSGQPKMNTAFVQDISPLEQAKLALQKQGMQSKEDIAEQNRQSREDIATQGISSREKIANDKANIAQQRADTYAWKAKHPGAKLMEPKGGNAYLIDPITHETFDTGVSTGTMTDEDRQNLIGSQKISQIEATGEQTRQNIAARGQAQQDIEADRPVTPTRQVAAAQQVLINNPELSDVIKISSDGKGFMFAPPKAGWFGNAPDPNAVAKYNKAKDLYNAELKSPTKKSTSTENVEAKPTKTDTTLNDKAKKFLTDNGLPVTDANIQHAIKTGKVK